MHRRLLTIAPAARGASERSDADAGPPHGFFTSSSRSRRRAPAPEDIDDLGLLVCDDDLELIAGEVDYHANALKQAVAVRCYARDTRVGRHRWRG